MKQKAQDGFTLVETLLIVLILVVVGFAGYYVWDRQNDRSTDSKKVASSKPVSSDDSGRPKSDETDSWTLYETPDKAYAIRIAGGLTVMKSDIENNEDNGNFLIIEHVSPIKGQPVQYVPMPQKDEVLGFSINFGVQAVYGAERATPMPSLKTKDGTEVKKYKFTQTTEPDGIDIPVGATEYIYAIKSKGKTVVGGYTSMDSAQLDTVEKMIKTIQIR